MEAAVEKGTFGKDMPQNTTSAADGVVGTRPETGV